MKVAAPEAPGLQAQQQRVHDQRRARHRHARARIILNAGRSRTHHPHSYLQIVLPTLIY